MKKYIKNNQVPELVITVTTDHPLLHIDQFDDDYVFSTVDLSKYDLPDRPVISKDRNRVTQHMIDDFEGFVEDVELLCEEDYGLVLTYENTSDDHSHYYNYLATDEEGNIVMRLRLRLRISNHPPKRSKQQKAHKSDELNSPKLHELLDEESIKNLTKYTKIITVNDETYPSYRAAFQDVNQIIEHAVEVMTR